MSETRHEAEERLAVEAVQYGYDPAKWLLMTRTERRQAKRRLTAARQGK